MKYSSNNLGNSNFITLIYLVFIVFYRIPTVKHKQNLKRLNYLFTNISKSNFILNLLELYDILVILL